MSLPSSPVLKQLHHLDRSSPDFHDQLSDVFYGSEYIKYTQSLQGDDLMWLVDYLDKVRRRVRFPPLSASASLGSRWSRSFRSCFPQVST